MASISSTNWGSIWAWGVSFNCSAQQGKALINGRLNLPLTKSSFVEPGLSGIVLPKSSSNMKIYSD